MNKLSVICDNCSNSEKMCSMCLKKQSAPGERTRRTSGCSSCGKG